MVEGCKIFMSSYYQLGFIPKALFLERLKQQPKPGDMFLLYSMLSVSARFTPSLVRRFKGGLKATEVFADIAAVHGLHALHKPSVENTQAFFLLGLAEWGSGNRNRGSVCVLRPCSKTRW
jgi:hypothetical protein